MAAKVVGGAFLSSFLNAVLDRQSSPGVVNLIRAEKLDLKLVRRMKTTLYAARALLNDAERRQIKDKDVKDWLDDLKDAVYLADDLSDEVSTKAAIQKDAGVDGLETIGAEFYSNDESCCETLFPSLETLEIGRMSSLQVWHLFEFDTFPQLKKLKITDCPILMGDLPNYLQALEKLSISECKQLACFLPRAPTILELVIVGNNKVRIQELPLSLRSLTIGGCLLVEFACDTITHTQPTCFISNCSSAISFPEGCMPALLQSLQIIGCRNLEFPMQQQHELLQSLLISNSCDSLTSFLLVGSPNLKTLTIKSCENMKYLVVPQSHDAALSSLRSMSIFDCTSFVFFSTLGMAASQLEYLTVECCPEIDSFPEEGLLPNLRVLYITNCKKLVIASMDLHSHGLNHLGIYGACDSVKSFPNEGCLPALLECLSL